MNVEELLRSLNREHWSPRLQRTYYVENTAVFLSGTDAQSTLSADGRKFHKPILSNVIDGVYSPGSDIDDTDLVSEDQELEVDQKRYGSTYIDDVSVKQNFYAAVNHAASDIQRTLNNRIEQHFLSQIDDAGHTLDAGEITDTNVVDMFTGGHTLLDSSDVPMFNRVAVVGPHTVQVMRRVKGNRETMLGDQVLQNGVIGPWQGWTVVQNNNLPYSADLLIATQPQDGDTISIAGVTFTFKTALSTSPAVPGEVLIGGSVANARANLKSAIEGGGTPGTDYTPVKSKPDRFTLLKRGVSITSDETMKLSGFGDIIVSSDLTDGTDGFSNQKQHSWFGMRGATDLVVQLPGAPEFTRVEKRFGTRAKALALYGAKTFDDGAEALIDVQIDASNWI